MPNVNRVTLMGNLTRDPELRYLPKGTAVCQFGLAINRTWTDDGGKKHEEVTFVDIEAFGKTAELIGEHLKKGRPLYIEGRLKLDQWDDKTTGKKMSKLRVVADTFQYIDSKPKEGSEQQAESPDEESAEEKRLAAALEAAKRKRAALLHTRVGQPTDDPDLPY